MPLTNAELDSIADRVWSRRRTHATMNDQPPVAVLADLQRVPAAVDQLRRDVDAIAAKLDK